MSVKNDQPRPSAKVTQAQRWHPTAPNTPAVNNREPVRGERRADLLVECVDQRQQRRLVHQTGAGRAGGIGRRQRDIGVTQHVVVTERAFQPSVTQGLRCASLVARSTEAVEGRCNQLDAGRRQASTTTCVPRPRKL